MSNDPMTSLSHADTGRPALPAVRHVSAWAPLRWLAARARDFVETGCRGAFYALAFVLMGAILATRSWPCTTGRGSSRGA